MTESKIEVGDPPVSMPRITIRDFLLGMLAIAVLNSAVLILFVSAIPLLALVGAAFLHSSLFKMHILFVLGLIIAISLGANIVQIALWCTKSLFSSMSYRIFALLVLAASQSVIMISSTIDYLDFALVISVLCFSVWDAASNKFGSN